MLIGNRTQVNLKSKPPAQEEEQAVPVAQIEALINEYKGHLFEYLLAKQLAEFYQLEGAFLCSIPKQQLGILQRQQSWLYERDRELYQKLPELAKASANRLLEELPGKVDSLWAIGKLAAGGQDDRFKETDILIEEGERQIFLSVKLCKAGSFVNTKSAGLLSFLTRYFGVFDDSEIQQQTLNLKVKSWFNDLGRDLYEMAGLEYPGKFDPSWVQAGLSELPGQLSRPMNARLLQYYYQIITEIYQCFENWVETNPQQLKALLAPILGFGEESIWQLSCFHQANQKGRYELADVQLSRFDEITRGQMQLGPLKSEISSFEILFEKYVLQIRVKPMNKFTTMSLKINCSVKKRGAI